MTEDEFYAKVIAEFPQAEIGMDNEGQLVIYTGMTVNEGEVEPLSEEVR
jgi:hypothetical protein